METLNHPSTTDHSSLVSSMTVILLGYALFVAAMAGQVLHF
jgi:hypothetical protein